LQHDAASGGDRAMYRRAMVTPDSGAPGASGGPRFAAPPMRQAAYRLADLRSVRRVVIDFKCGDVPIVHVELHGDGHLLDVVQSLDGIVIKREGDG
jgi:hypothetical protein